jgi:uncharacterized protein YndB with AHSA1/START domain
MMRPLVMPGGHAADAPSLDLTIEIGTTPQRVFDAFFDPTALRAWWQAAGSVTTPRPLGPYAIQWPASDFRDEILGRLGGVFRGTIMHVHEGAGFFVADGFWLPPDSEPIGPMALEVTCTPVQAGHHVSTRLRVTQTGCDDSVRWRRYYEVIRYGWEPALAALKAMLEESGRDGRDRQDGRERKAE